MKGVNPGCKELGLLCIDIYEFIMEKYDFPSIFFLNKLQNHEISIYNMSIVKHAYRLTTRYIKEINPNLTREHRSSKSL